MGWILAAMLAAPAIQSGAAERVHVRGNVPVISGGVGEDSLARLQAREKEFNLKLVFALVEGNYVADVGVMISDAAGTKLVEHVTDGPIFMARLPAGNYVVAAYYNGNAQARKVSVRGDRLHTEHLRWPSDPRVDFPGPADGRKGETVPRPGAKTAVAQQEDTAPVGIAFLSGGIGESAQAQLLAREKEFNLKLVFSLLEGNYVSDTRVEVRDATGRVVIAHVCEGPFFLARLPAGTYALTAAYEGQTQARKVSVVSGHLRTEYIRWRSNPQTDSVLPPER